jgi:hypothetical protein
MTKQQLNTLIRGSQMVPVPSIDVSMSNFVNGFFQDEDQIQSVYEGDSLAMTEEGIFDKYPNLPGLIVRVKAVADTNIGIKNNVSGEDTCEYPLVAGEVLELYIDRATDLVPGSENDAADVKIFVLR